MIRDLLHMKYKVCAFKFFAFVSCQVVIFSLNIIV